MKKKLIEVLLIDVVAVAVGVLGMGFVGCTSQNESDDQQVNGIYDENFSNIMDYCQNNAQLINGKYKLSWDQAIASNLLPSSFDLTISPEKNIFFEETFSTGVGNFYYNIYTTITFIYGNVDKDTMTFNAKWKLVNYDYGKYTSQEIVDSKAKLTIQNNSFVVDCSPEINTSALNDESFSNTIWSSFQRLESFFVETIQVNLFER